MTILYKTIEDLILATKRLLSFQCIDAYFGPSESNVPKMKRNKNKDDKSMVAP